MKLSTAKSHLAITEKTALLLQILVGARPETEDTKRFWESFWDFTGFTR